MCHQQLASHCIASSTQTHVWSIQFVTNRCTFQPFLHTSADIEPLPLYMLHAWILQNVIWIIVSPLLLHAAVLRCCCST
jgi:hypothetical protein